MAYATFALYKAQLERVAQWETYWRARIASEKSGPPPGLAVPLLLGINAEYRRLIKKKETELAGTYFEPGGAHLHELTRATVPTRGTVMDKWQLSITLAEMQSRHWHFEALVNLCLDAGTAPTDIIRHMIRANLLYCKTVSAILMHLRLSGTGAQKDALPMLAGLASAQMFIGQNRLRRQKALEAIFWQEHPKSLHPFPSKMQLRAVLNEQALHAVPRLLPFVSQTNAHQHTASLAAQQGLPAPEAFPLTPKQGAMPMLRLAHRETHQALLSLPTALDNYMRGTAFPDAGISEEDAPSLPITDWQDRVSAAQLAAWNDGNEDPLASLLWSENTQAVLASLSAAEHDTFLLLRDGLTQSEIAACRKESVSAVEKRLSRLKRRTSRAA